MSKSQQKQSHTGPIKTPRQLLIASILAFVVPVFSIIGIAHYAVR